MRDSSSRWRTLAASATGALTLCLVVLAAFGSSAPAVSIAALASIDEGSTVQTVGLVADLWAWDDGTENLLLVEVSSRCTVVVVCHPAIRAQPSAYIDIGDEVRVSGRVFGSFSPRELHTDSDRLALVRPCEFVMTVDALANSWQLFEGDEISVRGVLLTTGEGEHALRGMSSTLPLDCVCSVPPTLMGRDALVSGRLLFDESSFKVALRADSVTAC